MFVLSLFFTVLKVGNIIKIFNSIEEVYECYGKDNIVPITNLRQVIFYTSKKYSVQPKWIEESTKTEGHMCFYFHKGETAKCYTAWMENRPQN